MTRQERLDLRYWSRRKKYLDNLERGDKNITMTKEELVAEMKKAGVRDSRMKHPLWEEAFKQYNAANPNNKRQYSLCGSCFSRVSEWLGK